MHCHYFLICFREIYIPTAVSRELGDLNLPKAIQQRDISISGHQFVLGEMGRLHAGELEAMRLATELRADYVCLDDLTQIHGMYLSQDILLKLKQPLRNIGTE